MNELTELHYPILCPKSVLLLYLISYKADMPAMLGRQQQYMRVIKAAFMP